MTHQEKHFKALLPPPSPIHTLTIHHIYTLSCWYSYWCLYYRLQSLQIYANIIICDIIFIFMWGKCINVEIRILISLKGALRHCHIFSPCGTQTVELHPPKQMCFTFLAWQMSVILLRCYKCQKKLMQIRYGCTIYTLSPNVRP